MSLSQRSLGRADVKARLMRFGDALVLRESVVTRKRRIALGRIPALCISLATVLRQHGASWAPRCASPAAPRTGPARRTAVDSSRRRRTSLRFPSEVDGRFFYDLDLHLELCFLA